MRLAPIAVAAALTIAFVAQAEAQQTQTNSPTRLTVTKRSYLDAGTVVKPGSKSYLDYTGTGTQRFPSYGGEGGITGSRFPLPSPGYLPGY